MLREQVINEWNSLKIKVNFCKLLTKYLRADYDKDLIIVVLSHDSIINNLTTLIRQLDPNLRTFIRESGVFIEEID